MLISEDAALERLNSPLNLINRMKVASPSRGKAMGLFGVGNANTQSNQIAIPNRTNTLSAAISEVEAQVEAREELDSNPRTPTLDALIDDSDNQIKLAGAHNKALEVLHKAVSLVGEKLDDIDADKLPAVINATAKVVDGIRRERNESQKNAGNKTTNIIFYTPVQKSLEQYETIDV